MTLVQASAPECRPSAPLSAAPKFLTLPSGLPQSALDWVRPVGSRKGPGEQVRPDSEVAGQL